METPLNPQVMRLIDMALEEDLGTGDATSEAVIPAGTEGKAVIIAKQPLIAAGMDVCREVFLNLDPDMEFVSFCREGERMPQGEPMASVEGSLRALLAGERTALNFLQRMSGVATHVDAIIKDLPESSLRVTDTRKTTPGWRVLEKYAVRVGGAANHRMGLFDGILIKDNHIVAAGGVTRALERARKNAPHTLALEVEAADLAQVEEALEAGAHIIMCDNMDNASVKEAVAMAKGRALIEVSGNVDKERLETLVGIGVDIVSIGALTHGAKAVDISMRVEQCL